METEQTLYSPLNVATEGGDALAAEEKSAPYTPTKMSTKSEQRHPAIENDVIHRGGFATSICDLFQDPHDRSSCCAITCCGTFLRDRNHYLLTGEMPPPWWTRFLFYIVGCLLSLILVGAMLGSPLLAGLGFILFVMSRENARRNLRIILKMRMQAQDPSWAEEHENLPDDGGAHGCLTCFHNDRIYKNRRMSSNKRLDFCAKLWNVLGLFCCKLCCNSWCTLCGMCETGQEHRELRRMLPRSKFFMDYITMEHWSEYYPKIQALREQPNTGFWDHWKALSRLSGKLIDGWLAFTALAVAIPLLLQSSGAASQRVAIMGATLANAGIILYVTHWRNHRNDLSLDAVIKLFASGFFLSTLSAFVIGTVLDTLSTLVVIIVMGAELFGDGSLQKYLTTRMTDRETDALILHFMEDHWSTYVAYLFFEAFIVAALVEELSKYFSYFMVEHGDWIFESPSRSAVHLGEGHGDDDASSVATDPLTPPQSPDASIRARGASVPVSGGGTNNDGDNIFTPRQALSPSATASMITVGMVATATGFSCSENLMCVFGQKSVVSELFVLALRAMFPVHSLCAAIQSIGVVKRDVEKVEGYGIGWAILPAVILHGMFDFVLFTLSFLRIRNGDVTFPPSSRYKTTGAEEEDEPLSWDDVSEGLVPSLIIMGIGCLYYIWQAKAQRCRLAELDRFQPDIVLSPPFLVS